MDLLAAIKRDSDLFYATADGADATLGVPSCPDWTIADLVWHLAEVHWFWATVIEMKAENPDVFGHIGNRTVKTRTRIRDQSLKLAGTAKLPAVERPDRRQRAADVRQQPIQPNR